jgi:type III secretion protein J
MALGIAAALCAGCSVDILHDIPESQANEVVAVLQREGVQADKERTTEGSSASYTVSVRRGDAPRAWRILRQKHLPRPKEQGLGEVFGNLGLIPTATQEHALLRHALAGEIARTLNSIDGVRQARVHVVLPDRDPLAPPGAVRPEPRAAVLLKVDSTLDLPEDDVRRLVAGSVEGLSPKAVNVVFSRTNPAESSDGAAALVTLGPFHVAAESRPKLTAALVGAIVLLLALALAVLFLLRHNRALARRASQREVERPFDQNALASSLALIERSISGRPGARL